jgi:hypothetical protein
MVESDLFRKVRPRVDVRISMDVPVILCGALPSGLKWTEAALNTYYNHETPMI